MDRALLALCALLLNAGLAGPRHWYVRVGITTIIALPQHFLRHLERKLNRDHRSANDRQIRGAVLLAVLVVISIGIGFLADSLLNRNWQLLELFLLILLLPLRQGFDIANDIRKALQENDVISARACLEGSLWRHHARLDEHGLARAAVETLMVQFCDKILTPTIGYLLFGLPGFFVVKTVTLLQETLIKPTPEEAYFNAASQWAYILIHYVPSRIAALLCVLAAALMPAGNPRAITSLTQGTILTDPPRQLMLRVASSSLALSLGGPMSPYVQAQWLGDGVVRAGASDIRRALYLYGMLNVLLFILLGLFL